jgi:hypothetical protein
MDEVARAPTGVKRGDYQNFGKVVFAAAAAVVAAAFFGVRRFRVYKWKCSRFYGLLPSSFHSQCNLLGYTFMATV